MLFAWLFIFILFDFLFGELVCLKSQGKAGLNLFLSGLGFFGNASDGQKTNKKSPQRHATDRKLLWLVVFLGGRCLQPKLPGSLPLVPTTDFLQVSLGISVFPCVWGDDKTNLWSGTVVFFKGLALHQAPDVGVLPHSQVFRDPARPRC